MNGKSYETDEEGYLVNLAEWNEAVRDVEQPGRGIFRKRQYQIGRRSGCKDRQAAKPDGLRLQTPADGCLRGRRRP
ncbi:MAG: hypothetical protein IPO75_15120 [Betaproteobacteria bacterium]|nr:hypothetical protein [Betaproteobacteria bacterium]